MNPPEKLSRLLKVPYLTWARILLALTVAVAADALQWLFGPLGWEGPDQVIDLLTMILISRLIGFHLLLLPTFVIGLIPVVDELPTWIACTIAVIILRKREQHAAPPPPPPDKPVIDV